MVNKLDDLYGLRTSRVHPSWTVPSLHVRSQRPVGYDAAQVEEYTQSQPFRVATIRLLEERDPNEHSQATRGELDRLQL